MSLQPCNEAIKKMLDISISLRVIDNPEVRAVKTCPRAAMMICSRKETKLRHRLRTKVRDSSPFYYYHSG